VPVVFIIVTGDPIQSVRANYHGSIQVLDGVQKQLGLFENRQRGKGQRPFIKFAALTMRAHIQNMFRNHDRDVPSTKEKKDPVNGMTVDEVLLSLKTLMTIGNTGDRRLTAVTKNVRETFRPLGLEEPKNGQIVLSRLGPYNPQL